jgi:hypothetical protein
VNKNSSSKLNILNSTWLKSSQKVFTERKNNFQKCSLFQENIWQMFDKEEWSEEKRRIKGKIIKNVNKEMEICMESLFLP